MVRCVKKEALRKLLGKRRNASRVADRLFPLRGRQATRLAGVETHVPAPRDPRKLLVSGGQAIRIVIQVRPNGQGLAEAFTPGVPGAGAGANGDSI